jgi:hypothetical protein
MRTFTSVKTWRCLVCGLLCGVNVLMVIRFLCSHTTVQHGLEAQHLGPLDLNSDSPDRPGGRASRVL